MSWVLIGTFIAIVGLVFYMQGETLIKRFPSRTSIIRIFRKLKTIGKFRLILMVVGVVILFVSMILVGLRGQP